MSKFKKIIKVITVFLLVFIIALAAFFLSLKGKYIAPILMYHSINPVSDAGMKALIVSPEVFERQVRFLKTHKYNVIPLEELAALIKEKNKIPPKTLAITLDDGYRDNYTYAFPILKKYHIPAKIFIIVQEVGRPDRLSWSEIKEMLVSGVITFGSHTLSPEPLVNIKSQAERKRQIFDSKKVLQEKLGVSINSFSYPEGLFDQNIKQLVIDAGYKAAVATTTGLDYPADDIYLLKRLRISENAGNLFIFAAEISGYYTYMKEYKKYRKKHQTNR